MPGLIDAHWHAMMASLPLAVLMTADVGYVTLVAADEARRTLMRGFTSVRDMAGPTFSLKRAIDSGLVPGPRIWPSGAMISQTGGHGDFRFPYEVPAAPNALLSRGDALGGGAIADGVDRVLQRAREQLMLGASQLKLAAGGGVSSAYDPIDASQYTRPSSAPRSTPRRIGAPMSPCTPIRPARSRPRSAPACDASSMGT
jgi:imidazolonepropionase-like amidohydrolase